jgi:hypothetical protein
VAAIPAVAVEEAATTGKSFKFQSEHQFLPLGPVPFSGGRAVFWLAGSGNQW